MIQRAKKKKLHFLWVNGWWLGAIVVLVVVQTWAQLLSVVPLHKEVTAEVRFEVLNTLVSRHNASPHGSTQQHTRVGMRIRVLGGSDDALIVGSVAQVYCYKWCEQTAIAQGGAYAAVITLTPLPQRQNPTGFDFKRWLQSQQVVALGWVRTQPVLVQPPGWLDRLHQTSLHTLNQATTGLDFQPLLLALATGQRHHVSPQQERTLIETGTMHLLVVSGMHLGLVFGLCLVLLRALGTPVWVQLIGAVLCASAYAWLSGFQPPTQRALLMLCVGVWFVLRMRLISPWYGWLLALLVVASWQPYFWHDAGIVLSFSAVAILLAMRNSWSHQHWLRSLLAAQWGLFVVLGIVQALFFYRITPSGLLANMVLVPVVSFALLPLTLLGVVGALIDPSAGWLFFVLGDWIGQWAWRWLDWLHKLPYASIELSGAIVHDWTILVACIAMAATLLLPPAFFMGRVVAIMALVPLVWWQARDAMPPLVLATQTDTYVVMREHEQILVVAAAQGSTLARHDMRFVLVPVLRYAQARQIDWLALNQGAAQPQLDGKLRHDQSVRNIEYCQLPLHWRALSLVALERDGCALRLGQWLVAPEAPSVSQDIGLIMHSRAYATAVAEGRDVTHHPCVVIGRHLPASRHCLQLGQAQLLYTLQGTYD